MGSSPSSPSRTSTSVKREMSNAHSPILSHFGAAIAGIEESTIFSALAIYLVHGTGAAHAPGFAANIGFSLNVAVGFHSMVLWWVKCLNELKISGNRSWSELIAENLSAKCNTDGPEILHGSNFHIKPGGHVGVVGRTFTTRTLWLRAQVTLEHEVSNWIHHLSVSLKDSLSSSLGTSLCRTACLSALPPPNHHKLDL
ncbi:hypothetical protein BDM02DRAFT_3268759 [Thelephora ganbajun]|uniref:Uncharacterized protein n=1 Tax=Thelephora ganbajun TaxID=370292 RepID=A0ACB6ZJ47_THEGA|nr:hypothetical protein BDM02DRAFT_3268759 [Thelephora ganbajun]